MTGSVTIAVGTLADGGGGITRVGRMTIRALGELGEAPAVIGFLDRPPHAYAGIDVAACSGSKAAFAARVAGAALTSSAILYDSIGLARAHPPLIGSRCRAIAWMHGVEVWEALTPKYARALRRMDLVLANSAYTLARHERLHGKLAAARVCPLSTEEDDAPARRADFAGPPTALIVGRIDATEGFKGHNALLEAWPTVSAAVPSARLVIGGAGSGLEDIRRRAAECGAPGSIQVLGFVTDRDLPDLYRSAHVFAMPSRQEGFGIAYVEAMRYGLSVIASRQDAGQEVNVEGVTGYNVDLDAEGQLADRLIGLLSSRERARAFGAAGALRWAEHYRYSQFKARFAAIWHEQRIRGQLPAAGNSR